MKIKGTKLYAVLLPAAILPVQAFADQDDYVFQGTRCAIAYSVGINSDPSVGDKSALAMGLYIREHGVESATERKARFDAIVNELVGPPDSFAEGLEDRAQKIAESDFCKRYLSDLQSK
jgi:hypothetical protein